MKIFILTDTIAGYEIINFLNQNNEDIVGIALHPKKHQKNSKETLSIIKTKNIITLGKKIQHKEMDFIKKLKPDVILVIFWRFLLDEKFQRIARYGCINFHIGLLPFNRGVNPNMWPIIENTPAGSTIHKIDNKIDAGNIICQKKTKFDILDSGETLHYNLVKDIISLFKQNWFKMKKNKFVGRKQNLNIGTIHYRKQFKDISKIDLKKKYFPLDLFNLLRAKMFKGYPPAYFVHRNKKIFVSIKLRK